MRLILSERETSHVLSSSANLDQFDLSSLEVVKIVNRNFVGLQVIENIDKKKN